MAQIKYYIESTWCEGQAAPYVGEEIFLLDTARANVLPRQLRHVPVERTRSAGQLPTG